MNIHSPLKNCVDVHVNFYQSSFYWPGNSGNENNFGSQTKALIPCFVHLLGQSKELKLPSDLKEEALQCLLVKAGFEAAYCGQDLSYAERLLREDPGIPRYLEVALSYRQSVLARLSADYSTSHAYINKVLSSTENDEPDRRFNTWQIYLKLSQLKNLTMQEEFVKAHRELTAW